MIFATVALVCAFQFTTDRVECNEYIVDHAHTKVDGDKNTKARDEQFNGFYMADDVDEWVKRYNIGETSATIETVEFETKEFLEDMIP